MDSSECRGTDSSRGLRLSGICFAAALLAGQAASQGTTQLISKSSSGVQGDSASAQVAMSSDGRYFTYVSSASNLVSGDTNGVDDIFVYDSLTGQTTRVSVDSAGNQANGASGNEKTAISDDGRFVVFASWADNLVAGDTNAHNDLFLRDRLLGRTTRVSVDAAGNQVYGNTDDGAISADGRMVACDSDAPQLWYWDTNNEEDVIVFDLLTGVPVCASVAPTGQASNGESLKPAISADGRWVAFTSSGSDLVANDTNNTWDTFLRDLQSGQTWRVSVDSAGGQANGLSNSVRVDLSDDGRYVAFMSIATNLVPGDTNGLQDVFVHDHLTGQIVRVNVDSAGLQAIGGGSSGCSLSSDARYVAFGSFATNLVPGDTNNNVDIFLHDQLTGVT
jgi:Tol biopolymer transport system component